MPLAILPSLVVRAHGRGGEGGGRGVCRGEGGGRGGLPQPSRRPRGESPMGVLEGLAKRGYGANEQVKQAVLAKPLLNA